jgi:hypothetical protein
VNTGPSSRALSSLANPGCGNSANGTGANSATFFYRSLKLSLALSPFRPLSLSLSLSLSLVLFLSRLLLRRDAIEHLVQLAPLIKEPFWQRGTECRAER